MSKKYVFLIVFLASFGLFFCASPVLADLPPSLVSSNDGGAYTANDLLLVLINISAWVLFLSGAAALLAFIVGGTMMLVSAGNKDLVSQGKAALIAAVVGIAIVLLAFTAVNYFVTSLGFERSRTFGNWYQSK